MTRRKRAWSILWAARFVARWEGKRLYPYLDPVGIPTQGFGHTGKDINGKPLSLASPPITTRQAMRWLAQDLREAAAAVNRGVNVPITVRQRMALISLAFNIGTTAFLDSTLLELLNDRRYHKAADQFLRWNKAGWPLQVLEGLTRRRRAERAMFLSRMPKGVT